MQINYVLIDYENVQPAALSFLETEHFKVFVFVGAGQSKVNFDVAESLQRLGPNATYVKISGNGRNALDFHIAYYIGQIAAIEKNAFFHIISKDTGFDPLIAHLRSKNIHASRFRSVHDIPIVKAGNSNSPTEMIAAVVSNLNQRGASKPRTVKTLSSTINSLFQKTLSEDDVSSLVKLLEKQEYISITNTKVTYALAKQHC